MYAAILSYIPIMISVYHTGGIYSADLAWVFVCMISQGLIIEYWWGIFSSIMICSYISYLYLIENQMSDSENIFKNYVIQHGNGHYFLTWVFVVILIAALIATFAKVLDNTSKKLEALSQQKIHELEVRVKQKTEELSQLRSSLARDFHDEMGNKLASINILSQSVAFTLNNKNENPEAIQLLETISTRSKELFDGTKDFIWSIDFKSDYLFELYVYLREFGERFFNEMDINFYSNTNVDSQTLFVLKSTYGRQLILVSKEIMTNAAKHANCSEVTFSITVEKHMATISITDNGKGFDIKNTIKRGLSNIDKRLNQIGAKYQLVSADNGTTYMIQINGNLEN
jgi:signal transduction histidine kinase